MNDKNQKRLAGGPVESIDVGDLTPQAAAGQDAGHAVLKSTWSHHFLDLVSEAMLERFYVVEAWEAVIDLFFCAGLSADQAARIVNAAILGPATGNLTIGRIDKANPPQ